MKYFALILCFFLLPGMAAAQAPQQTPAAQPPSASSVVGALAAADATGGATAPVGAAPATGPGALPPPAGTAATTPGAPGAPVDPAAAGGATTPVNAAPQPESTVPKDEPFTRSFFFLAEDLSAINKALQGIKQLPDGLGGPTDKPIPQIRTITVTGISYFNNNNWIVWLNGKKITPWITLKEIEEIKVEPGVVHLKWFDIGANKVLRLSMRPHEIYDIVTGVTLPDQAQVKMEGAKR